MQLDEGQRKKIAEWVEQGLKLSEIQNRLTSELGLQMTYMEVRMLVDDLKLVPKDAEPPKNPAPLPTAAPSANDPAAMAGLSDAKQEKSSPGTGKVSVVVDQITRPGAVVSGKVTFSDGQRAEWYFDQTGRLALATQQPGYRPPQADLQQFQAALDAELSRLGF